MKDDEEMIDMQEFNRKDRKPTKQKEINHSNLHKITLMVNQNREHIKTICTTTINMHSVKNKDLLLSGQLHNVNIDLAVLTETWLKDTPEDNAWLHQSELMKNNYTVKTHNMPSQKKGGGIALVHKKSLNTKQLEQGNTPTMEYVVWKTITSNTPIHLIGLYHTPPTDGTTTTMFLDDITELLTTPIHKYDNIMLLGDLNMHIEDISNAENIIFNDAMEVLGLI